MTWFVDTLLVTGALIALVLVLRRPVARAFGPGLAYALWLLPLARLIVPPLVLPAEPVEAGAPLDVTVRMVGDVDAPAAMPAIDYMSWTLGLWLVGAALFLGWRLHSYFAMRRAILEKAVPVGEAGRVRLVESPIAHVPMAFGIIDKVVALPRGFMALQNLDARDLAIAHELEHHAGRDLVFNLAIQPLMALHWFNPLAWAGWRALRRDQEAACDARVLAGRDGAVREAYGRLIAAFATGSDLSRAPALACAVVTEKNIIHRLRSLTMTQHTARRRRLGRMLIGAAALALPLTATVTYASAEDPPAPPAPPAAPASPEAPTGTHHQEKRVMIVERHGADAADSAYTRTETRDGKTFVFKTDKPLSDEELEAKIAEAEKAGAEARASAGRSIEAVAKSFGCEGSQSAVDVAADDDKDGQRQQVRLRVCIEAKAKGQALAALREAREGLERNAELTEKIRAKVLKELDQEIERLSRES